MSDGTLSTDLENIEFTPSVDPQYDGPNESDAETARLVAKSGELADAEFMQYMQEAATSGVDTGFLGGIFKKAGTAIDMASAWAKSNPELAKMLASGVGTAMKNKQDRELAEQKNQWDIDKENRKNAREDQLWQRRNDSITGMKQDGLGLIGSAMYDNHLKYLQSRK